MQENNTIAQPIGVSSVRPIYNNRGQIIEWRLVVKTKDIKFASVRWIDKVVALMPRAKGEYSVSFSFDTENNFAEIEYFFPDGFLKNGFNRAWDFRIKMLSQMAKQNNEKAK